MKVGLLMVFQNFSDRISDTEVYKRDIGLASLAEDFGFDTLGGVEHHFSNYSMLPDNMDFLGFMAARTSRIKLLTGAVILPWWKDPMRVVEKMIMLDHFSEGRALFGIGCGLARREYETFGIDMNEARERFAEAAELILKGLETGVVEADGKYYKQKRTEIRPRPYASFEDRFYCVASSVDSLEVCARLGGKMMCFAQKPWEMMLPHFDLYRSKFQEYRNCSAPPPVCVDFLCCDESSDRAEELARDHMSNYFITVMDHYEMMGDHFKTVKGYGDYAANVDLLKEAGKSGAANDFVNVNTWGTPNQILEKLEKRRQSIGEFDLTVQISYGGMSGENARRGMELFARKVLPEIQSWGRSA